LPNFSKIPSIGKSLIFLNSIVFSKKWQKWSSISTFNAYMMLAKDGENKKQYFLKIAWIFEANEK
jgi:hypothetical protein